MDQVISGVAVVELGNSFDIRRAPENNYFEHILELR